MKGRDEILSEDKHSLIYFSNFWELRRAEADFIGGTWIFDLPWTSQHVCERMATMLRLEYKTFRNNLHKFTLKKSPDHPLKLGVKQCPARVWEVKVKNKSLSLFSRNEKWVDWKSGSLFFEKWKWKNMSFTFSEKWKVKQKKKLVKSFWEWKVKKYHLRWR